jgi:hypothetical protein
LYCAEITAEIQKGYWGHTIDPQDPSEPLDQARFAYPLYVLFLLFPTVTLSFDTVRIRYFIVAAAGSIGSVWLWLRVFGHRGFGVRGMLASTLLMASLPVVYALHVHQLVSGPCSRRRLRESGSHSETPRS